MRELRVEDALLYLDQVKVEFGDRPHIYNEFLDIMKTFKTQQIDTPGVIRRVSNLFQGNKRLVLGFNTFLPEGYKIELPLDGDGPAVAVFRAPGETVTHILGGPNDGQSRTEITATGDAAAASAGAGMKSAPGVAAAPEPPRPPPQPSAASLARAGLPPHAQAQMHPSQQPLRGPALTHAPSQPGAAPGALGKPPGSGILDRAAPGAGPQAYPPGVHSQPGALGVQRDHARAGLPGQPPQSMLGAAAEAAARARLEQHRGPGPAVPGRLGHPPPPGGAVRGPGIGGTGPQPQALGSDSKLPPGAHLGAGSPHQPAAAAPPARPTAGLQQQNSHLMQQQQAQQPPPAAGGAAPAAAGAPQPPLEFDHAINYVTTIKKRFAHEPETYKKFLEILHTYQKEQRGIKEVLEEVSVLFADHPDLLKEFTYFLPDAVQAQAKAQLDQVAKEAEARKRAASSKQAIMQQAQGMQRQAQQVTTTQHRPQPPVASPATPPEPPRAQPHAPTSAPVPFGASMGRSREKEREIYRNAVYGTISFAPVRPPRKNSLSVSQAASKNGRPTMLPRLPRQTSILETSFFERAKKHLSRKELAPDKPYSGTRVRHTPYAEFLKCLHLFGAGVLNKDELILLLRGLFMQGHAPKSGVNAGGGASNPSIANDAQELLREFEEVLTGRGPYADQEMNFKDKSKYGSTRCRDFDFRDCDRPTPSYVFYPPDYPTSLFMSNSGQTEDDAAVLESKLICVGAEHMRLSNSPEDYDAVRIRRNAYEEAMFRIEDERFEVDMAIERNAVAMRQLEPMANEVEELRTNEENDGQPIGRLRYQLKPRALNSIHINSIGRVYGDHGDEVIEHLARNPLSALPIVYKRLHQKDREWRDLKNELMKKWRAGYEANYEGCMDHLCYFNRRELERSFSSDPLMDECRRASLFVKNPERRTGSPSTFALSCPDRSALLFQPHLYAQVKPASISNQHAVRLVAQQVVMSKLQKADREKVGRVWAEFVVPFFNFPTHWVIDECRDSFRGEINNVVVKYATGQRVRTAYGDGTILSFLEGDAKEEACYRVKFAYGIGFIRPYAIIHGLESDDGAKYVRRDGQMEKEEESKNMGEDKLSSAVLDKKHKLLFGSGNIYLFLRLFSYLTAVLDEIAEDIRSNTNMEDPALSYYIPPAFTSEEDKQKQKTRLDFHSVMLNLQKVVSQSMEGKDFEAICRRVSKERVHQMAALPKLVETCAKMLIATAREDLLLHLYDFCQHPGQDPVQLRSQCLTIADDASFRIQYNSENGKLYFSYLPEGEEMLTAPLYEDSVEDEAADGGHAEDEANGADDDVDMAVEDEDEEIRQTKRPKLR